MVKPLKKLRNYIISSLIIISVLYFLLNKERILIKRYNFLLNNTNYTYYTYGHLNDSQTKIILVLHGNPANGFLMSCYTNLNEIFQNTNTMLIYPTAINNRWEYYDNTKIKLQSSILDKILTQTIKYNNRDINLIGFSGGGIFVFNYIMNTNTKFKNVAIFSGNINTYYKNDTLKMPNNLIYVHGYEDYLYDGFENKILSAIKTVNLIVNANNYDSLSTIYLKNYTKTLYKTKNNNSLKFYKTINAGHHWHGGGINLDFCFDDLGKYNSNISYNEIIKKEFK